MTVNKEQQLRSGLPLIRLSLATPFTFELDRREIDVDGILEKFNLSRDNLHSPDVFVTAPVMYKILEEFSESADDPYLAVYVGETLDIYSWPVFTNAARHASTFSDFFFRFSKEAGNQATSVKMRLDTDGEYATFRAYRVFDPETCPAQADAFYVGLFSSIFQRCAGDQWDPQQVRIQTCDTRAIPNDYQNVIVTRGDRRGCAIRFPQDWLLLPFDLKNFKQRVIPEVNYLSPPKSLVEAVHQALLPHIHQPELNNDMASELCGFDARALGRKLKNKGTTIGREIANLRKEQAIKLLIESDRTISDIASSVGFNDPSVFTRSFRRWVGMSPSDYRKRICQSST
ncbi:MAG: helix-turn-helix domain-containing protein [Arenicellales bacterium]